MTEDDVECEASEDNKSSVCPDCEGDGEIPDPYPCLRCGWVGCHLVTCVKCKGKGYIKSSVE